MALTITHVKSGMTGNAYEHVVDLSAASYTAAGEALTGSNLASLLPRLGPVSASGATVSPLIQFFTSERNLAGLTCVLDRAAGKILFVTATTDGTGGSNYGPVRCRVRYGMTGD